MATRPEATAFERGVGPLLRLVLLDKAEAVLGFRPDPALSDRIEVLAMKSTEGELTDEERAEYEGYVRANKFIAILQRQARRGKPSPTSRRPRSIHSTRTSRVASKRRRHSPSARRPSA